MGGGCFILLGAYTSANIMGLLVLYATPNQPCVYHMVVDESKHEGSKSKSLYLAMHSETDSRTYSLRLARKLFNYPEINAGDKMVLTGKENIFGVYVERFTVISGGV